MKNLSGPWGIGAVPSCLAPAPGVFRAGERWPGVREPHILGVQRVGSGLVGSHVRGALASESLTSTWNPPALGGAGFPGSAGAQLSDHQKHRIERRG